MSTPIGQGPALARGLGFALELAALAVFGVTLGVLAGFWLLLLFAGEELGAVIIYFLVVIYWNYLVLAVLALYSAGRLLQWGAPVKPGLKRRWVLLAFAAVAAALFFLATLYR
jgi:hypothetical protein